MRHGLALSVVCLLALTFPLFAQDNAASVTQLPSSRYAVLIGVQKYEDPSIPEVSSATNDVIQLKESLKRYAGFAEDNIIVLSDSEPYRKPTRENVLAALANIGRLVPENGLLLFMFSGHGISKGDQAFLLTSNAIWTSNPDLLGDTSLSVKLLSKRIADTKVKQVIVLLDACRDDPEKSKSLSNNLLQKPFIDDFDFAAQNRGIEASAIFYATSVDQRAYIDNNKKLGYFTEAVVDGLSGSAANNDIITLSGLIDYVQTSVPKMVLRDFGAERKQVPMASVSGYQPAHLVVAHTLPLPTPLPYTDWPLIGWAGFPKEGSGWSTGSFPMKQMPKFDLSLVDGRYRVDGKFMRSWVRDIAAPFGSAVDFAVRVKTRFVQFSKPGGVELVFGYSASESYRFVLSSDGWFELYKFNQSTGTSQVIIDWTVVPFKFDPQGWNEMTVVVEDQRIKCFLNSTLLSDYKDVGFAGGKVGLAISMYEAGSAVVDFDDFEFRRKQQ